MQETEGFESGTFINREEIDLITQQILEKEDVLRIYQREQHLPESLKNTEIELLQAELARLTSRRAELESRTDPTQGEDK